MKGVSKYGQFIVKKVTDENASNENSKKSSKLPSHTTKFTIKNGKLQPPLKVRSQNVLPENLNKHGRMIKSYFEVRQNDFNNAKNTKQQNVLFAKANGEKFHVYNDSESDSNGKTAFSRTLSASTTLTDEMLSLQQPSCSNFKAPSNPTQGLRMKHIQHARIASERAAAAQEETTSQPDTHLADMDSFSTPANSSGFFSASESVESSYGRPTNQVDDLAIHDSSGTLSSDVPSKKAKHSDSKEDWLDDDPGHLMKIYDADMYAYMRWREEQFFQKSRDFMRKQPELENVMRENLYDWFMDVVLSQNLSPCTYFLSVTLNDRLLSAVACSQHKLQLLGAACLLVASKMEDRDALNVTDMTDLMDKAYEPADIRRMERIVLRLTNFDIYFPPTADHYAHYFMYLRPFDKDKLEKDIRTLMRYLLELGYFYYEFVRIPPSRIGAAAYVLARYALELDNMEYEKVLTIEAHNKRCENVADRIVVDERPGMLLSNAQMAALDDRCWPEDLAARVSIERAQLGDPLREMARVYEQSKREALHSLFIKYQNSFCSYVSSSLLMPVRLPFDAPREPDIVIDVPKPPNTEASKSAEPETSSNEEKANDKVSE